MWLPVSGPNFTCIKFQVINSLKLEIMKRLIKNVVMCTVILLVALAFSSCEEKTYEIKVPTESNIAWPAGAFMSYLNGNVKLDVLPGAVTDPVKFTVNECYNGKNCNFLLNVISISPEMRFEGPVNVSLRYNGELANGEDLIDGCRLAVYCWENQEEFYNGAEGEILCCDRDEDNCTINFCIKQTGIFAVAMIEN